MLAIFIYKKIDHVYKYLRQRKIAINHAWIAALELLPHCDLAGKNLHTQTYQRSI